MAKGAKLIEMMDRLNVGGPARRLGPPLPSRTGEFTSPMSLTADWSQFYKHHTMTLKDITEVVQRLSYTPANLQLLQRGDLLLQYHFSPVKPCARLSPANSWYLSQWELSPMDALRKEHEEFGADWESQKPTWVKLDAEHKKKYGSRYIGCLVIVIRLGIAVEFGMQPIFAAREPEVLAQPDTRDMLTDLLEFCVGCVNTGVVLAKDAKDGDAVKPGKLHAKRGVKSGKTAWEWRPFPDEWDTVYGDALRSRKYKAKTAHPPVVLFYFKALLAAPATVPI
ncbi:hypothetical protein L227DRAFT_571630 [Lentinus tigrinus ALCF2SS1-6]|uniref:Uncharacterized protein n=2 Tax=Lentinus tigrinus TaxID=5365 RepID=A0A5C2SLP5_9APHY|nr:hypothetical protein L227DRAFT_571630 [Lentinus tigrinus ALCF2SS1-6]